MGIGFTIDSPARVAHLGIDSTISLVDDMLVEKMRKFYSEKFELPYQEITHKIDDFRAKRITSYLNLMKEIAESKLEEFKTATQDKREEIKEYFHLLPDSSELKKEFQQKVENFNLNDVKSWIRDHLSIGNVDVNIMTKVDKHNYKNGEQLPVEFNDAHAALRGFAKSNLNSSIVLSAGMNPRLYNYMDQFDDFYPNEDGEMKKQIILKVSDYRSALIQGKYLAKKGLWVSEYRVESGLNCGGHAFATEGHLMGPVLEEFKTNKEALVQQVWALLEKALTAKNRPVPTEVLPLRMSAQGGVGTAEEHSFLLDHFEVDSVGWGSPFLLVPEVTSVDNATRKQLADAREKDLYLSGISPLGVPFNSLRGNTKDIEKQARIDMGKPGSLCPKKYVELNYEFTEKGLCTASYRYQRLKIKELDDLELPEADRQYKYNKIVEKSCVCVGLGTAALISKGLDTKVEGPGVSVCPGPNIAYYEKEITLKEMVGHIYGRNNVIKRNDRPHMFVKELHLYIDHLRGKIDEVKTDLSKKQEKSLTTFNENLKEGVNYYQNLFSEMKHAFEDTKQQIAYDLEESKQKLHDFSIEIRKKFSEA
ncbi:hypothetical protein HNS38_16935 [Lentimicrobium sp. L6]|nr:hypothetical protein [Lentimicrobium sp. S6]NPD86461.1 hypothetical protein [Lentimicrobium sp. L6]